VAALDPDSPRCLAFVLDERKAPTRGSWHRHRRGQLVYAAEGVLTVSTRAGLWVAPPERAVWVPPGEEHKVASSRPFRLRTLYVRPGAAALPGVPRVVAVSPLVRELLRAAAEAGPGYPRGGPEERLVRVILDRLPALAAAPLLHLPEPADPQLARIVAGLKADPADGRTFDAWAKAVALTPRTAARRFVAQTGMTPGRWRKQLRLFVALERLGAGESVSRVAFAVGYRDVSSFIAVFRAALGVTPARYFRAPE